MKTIPSTWTRLVVAVAAPAWLLVVPNLAAAQERAVPRSRPAAAAPSAPAPAPAPVSTPATGQRSPSGSGGRSGTAAPRDGGAQPAGNGGSGSSGKSTAGRDSSESTPRSGGSEPAAGRRERGDQPVIATAVPRRSGPGQTGGGRLVIVPGGYGFYPWGYGGLGLGGYYGGYYDPYDPFGGYAGYGGYGGYGPYGGYGGGSSYYSSRDDDGAVRIKVKPRDASVYVDGYYVGHVDDYDGVFQRLHLATGPHRLEIRAQQYESLMVDVRIDPDQTITYRGEMRRIN